MTDQKLATRLESELGTLDQEIDGEMIDRLADYLDELARWNRAYNLTAVRDIGDMISRHLADSLSIRPFLHGERIIDIGSGAGLPGVPLALVEPAMTFVLLDSNSKKTRFLTHVTGLLGMQNTDVVRSRVEDYAPAAGFDTVTCRAFATLADICELAGHLLAVDGRILAMKGRYPQKEIDTLAAGWKLLDVHELMVPGAQKERHLVVLGPVPVHGPAHGEELGE
jgi:16S rRNA (guanine527-N7)-methyltransferase